MAGHGGKIPKETMANRLSGLWSRVNLTSDQVSLHELGGSDTTDEFLDWDTYDKGRYNTNSAPPPPVTAAVRGSAAKKKSERPKSFTYDSGDERTPKRKSKFQILPRKRESWHSSTTKMADAGTKKKKERLCNCCLKQPEKTEQGKAKKFRKCNDCKNEVCEQCHDRDGRCHECYVKLSVQINPKDLLDLPEKVLLHLLKVLHYQEEIFVNVQKPFLVKQILTRFRVFDTWDPMFYLQESVETLQFNRQSSNSIDSGGQMVKMPEDKINDGEPPQNVISKTAFINELEMINKKRLTPEQERKYTAGQSFPDSPYGRNIVPLHKIATPKYFDGLTETELKDILKNYSFEITGELQKHDLKYKVLQLWNVERKKGLDAMGKSQGSPYGGVFKGPSSDGSPTGLRKTISLQDIPSSSAIDSLSIHQMKALLAKYNRKPENYVMRQDLIYEVRLLWNQAKRQALEQQNAIDDTKIFAVGPRSTQTLPSRKWKSQDCLDDDHVDPGFHRSGSQYLRQAQGNVDTRKPKMEHYDLVLRDDIFPPPPPHLMTPLDEPFNRGPEYATLPRNYKIPVSNMQPGLRYGGTEPIQQSVVSKTPKAPPPPPPPLPKTAPPVSHKQIQQPQQQQKSFPMKSALSISLQDIHSLEDIASLSLRQMIHILENHSVNTDGIDEKPYLQQMVTQLWHNKRSEMVHKDDRPYLSYQLQQQQRHYASTTPGLEKKFESMTMTSSSSQPHLYYSREDPRSGHNQSPYSGQQFSGGSHEKSFSQVDLCVICQNRVADAILLNCGHMITCLQCSYRLDACPQCHFQIVKIMGATIKKVP